MNAGRSRTSSSIVDRSIMPMLWRAFSSGSPVTTTPTNQTAAATPSHINTDSVKTAANEHPLMTSTGAAEPIGKVPEGGHDGVHSSGGRNGRTASARSCAEPLS